MAIKLSNLQIGALAHKIKDEINTPIDSHNQKVYDSPEYKNFFTTNEECILLNQMSDKYNFSYLNSNLDAIRRFHFKELLIEKKYINIDTVEREIILATIDATDMESLIAAVSLKFK